MAVIETTALGALKVAGTSLLSHPLFWPGAIFCALLGFFMVAHPGGDGGSGPQRHGGGPNIKMPRFKLPGFGGGPSTMGPTTPRGPSKTKPVGGSQPGQGRRSKKRKKQGNVCPSCGAPTPGGQKCTSCSSGSGSGGRGGSGRGSGGGSSSAP